MFNVKKNLIIEVTTNIDAAYAFVKAINYKKELTFFIHKKKEAVPNSHIGNGTASC